MRKEERASAAMDEKVFQDKLSELVHVLGEFPAGQQERLDDFMEKARQRQDRMKQIITELSDSLDHLRLSVKYLVFDLEATRRENAYLRKIVQRLTEQGESGEAE